MVSVSYRQYHIQLKNVNRQYRYDTLVAIGAPLETELKLMDELAVKYLKSYQVWHHRRLLVTLMRKPRPELTFITRSLAEDSKNYHTWSYRQWLLAYLFMWSFRTLRKLGNGRRDRFPCYTMLVGVVRVRGLAMRNIMYSPKP